MSLASVLYETFFSEATRIDTSPDPATATTSLTQALLCAKLSQRFKALGDDFAPPSTTDITESQNAFRDMFLRDLATLFPPSSVNECYNNHYVKELITAVASQAKQWEDISRIITTDKNHGSSTRHFVTSSFFSRSSYREAPQPQRLVHMLAYMGLLIDHTSQTDTDNDIASFVSLIEKAVNISDNDLFLVTVPQLLFESSLVVDRKGDVMRTTSTIMWTNICLGHVLLRLGVRGLEAFARQVKRSPPAAAVARLDFMTQLTPSFTNKQFGHGLDKFEISTMTFWHFLALSQCDMNRYNGGSNATIVKSPRPVLTNVNKKDDDDAETEEEEVVYEKLLSELFGSLCIDKQSFSNRVDLNMVEISPKGFTHVSPLEGVSALGLAALVGDVVALSWMASRASGIREDIEDALLIDVPIQRPQECGSSSNAVINLMISSHRLVPARVSAVEYKMRECPHRDTRAVLRLLKALPRDVRTTLSRRGKPISEKLPMYPMMVDGNRWHDDLLGSIRLSYKYNRNDSSSSSSSPFLRVLKYCYVLCRLSGAVRMALRGLSSGNNKNNVPGDVLKNILTFYLTDDEDFIEMCVYPNVQPVVFKENKLMC
eukprot:PhM_4_TR9777/c0_g1_i2/m.39114